MQPPIVSNAPETFLAAPRYLIIAGLAYAVFYILLKSKWSFKKIQLKFPTQKDCSREIVYSLITSVIFAIVGTIIIQPQIRPLTTLYDRIDELGMGYFILSIGLSLLIHDTYFYWIHRLMHTKWGMKFVHITHHRSTNPSPWAAFAFHPLEAMFEVGILIVLVSTIPIHPLAILAFLILMTLYNVYGHLGWELYPKGFHKTWIGRWVNTSVCHNQHHKYFEGNYGLYFLFWDRALGTLRENYDSGFEEVTSRK